MFDRRRSERFAQLLDEGKGRRRHHRETDLYGELPELVSVAGRLTRAATEDTLSPDSDFRTGLRAMLMAKIEREGVGAGAQVKADQAASRAALAGRTQVVGQVRGGTGRTRAAVLVGVTTGAILLSGVSAASTDALPGDPLYQVKRSTERAQLAFAGSDASRGQLYLEFARARIGEASRVQPGQLAAVLGDMDVDTQQAVTLLTSAAIAGQDSSPLQAILTFVNGQRRSLEDGFSTTDSAVVKAMSTLTQAETRAKDWIKALQKGCPARQDADAFGPQPAC
jgi:Domain of unknown function (DUF5667)